jgi:hypothetical protein
MVRRQVWPRPPLPLPYWLLPRKMSPKIPSFLGAQETPSQTYLPSPLAYGWKQVTPVHALTCRLLPRQVNCPFSNEGALLSLRGSNVMEHRLPSPSGRIFSKGKQALERACLYHTASFATLTGYSISIRSPRLREQPTPLSRAGEPTNCSARPPRRARSARRHDNLCAGR